jgi:phage tail sheath protein FI
MASAFVSAGVYIQEKDDSLYAPALAPTIIGLVGTATKGPLNTATLITNEGQLIDTFGRPRTKDMGMHAAVEALKEGRLLYYVRIAGAAQAKGTINVLDAGSAATAASIGPSANTETFNFFVNSVETDDPGSVAAVGAGGVRNANMRITWDNGAGSNTTNVDFQGIQAETDNTASAAATYNLNGIAAGADTTITLRVDGGIVQTITFSSTDAIVIANGGYAALTPAGVAHVINDQAVDCHAFYNGNVVWIKSDTYGSDSIMQVTGGTANAVIGFIVTAETSTPNDVGDITAVTGAEIETVVEADATPNLAVTISATGTVTIATATTGASRSIELVSASSLATLGASPKVNLTPLDSTVNGTNTTAAANTVSFTAKTFGSHSSDIKVRITASTALSGTVKLEVLYRDVVVETYDKLLKSTAATPITGSYALETAINSGITGVFDASEYIVAASLSTSGENPAPGTYTLSAGNNGDDWTSGTVVGTISGVTRTGMQLFRDPEQIYVNILATPGISYAAVISEGLDICSTRNDCLYIADCPFGLSPANAVAWHNGDNSLTVTVDQESRTETNSTTFNSSFGALYYPFVQIFDKFNDTNIWIPPSALAMRTIAYTDAEADPWFAPAGPNRTQATSILDLEYSASLGERDLMQLPGNNVNPIANIAGVGISVYGQKTLQRASTALDRVNVRRLLLQAEKLIASSVQYLVFEPNDSIMWRRFVNLVSPVFEDIKARRGLYDFRVVADSSTTTDLLIDQNTFLGKIYLQPTKAAEKLIVSFNLVPTGANFEDYAQA